MDEIVQFADFNSKKYSFNINKFFLTSFKKFKNVGIN